jgi:hypothetical protein
MKKTIIGLLLALLTNHFATAQSLTFSVTTKTYYGSYAAKHVLACWITNSAGVYQYNLKRYGTNYLTSLTNWTACSSTTKKTDGTTSATLTSHSNLSFSWNCKNTAGTVVPDGLYYINVEFTEQEGTKQFVKYSFTKGTTAITSTAPTVVTSNGYYSTPLITYTAPTVALTPTEATDFEYIYSRSERSLQLAYDAANHNSIKLQLVNLKGQTVYTIGLKGSGKETVQLPDCGKGIYLLRLTDKEGWSQTKKLLL